MGNKFPAVVMKPPKLITEDSWIIFLLIFILLGIIHHLHVAMQGEFTSDTVNYVSPSTAILL